MTSPDLGHLGGSDGGAGTWLPDIWERIVNKYDLCSVIDVGCGEGNNTRWWLDRGLYVIGVDGLPAYIENNRVPREQLVLHDYTAGPFVPAEAFDLGWSSEFVEHVEAQFVDNFLATFTRCKHVCLTFATPGQGGHHHVNEQDEGYWIEKMAGAGFQIDREETERMRDTGRNVAYGRRTLTWFNRTSPVVPVAMEEWRYEYPLTTDSVVIDGGGYLGKWCRPIADKYQCAVHVFEPVMRFREEIWAHASPTARQHLVLHPYGIAATSRVEQFQISGDSTGQFAPPNETEEVSLYGIGQIFADLNLGHVDLLKLNIEGGEYEVLEAMLDADLMKRVRFLQVQWHGPNWCAAPFPGVEERRRAIKGRLFKTHRTTWESPWVWENYERK